MIFDIYLELLQIKNELRQIKMVEIIASTF